MDSLRRSFHFNGASSTLLDAEERLRWLANGSVVLGLGGELLMVAASEIIGADGGSSGGINEDVLSSTVLKSLVSASTLALLVLLLMSYSTNYTVLRMRGLAEDPHAVYMLLLELLVCGLHCPPFVHFLVTWRESVTGDNGVEEQQLTYSIEAIASVWGLARVYLLKKMMLLNAGVYRVHLASQRADANFIFKTSFYRHRWRCVLGSLLLTLLVFSYPLRVFERPTPSSILDQYDNALWLTFVTMTTVGYGDDYPRTSLGRLDMAGCCASGFVLIALFVITTQDMVLLDDTELTWYHTLADLTQGTKVKELAAMLIQANWRRRLEKRRKDKVVSFKGRSMIKSGLAASRAKLASKSKARLGSAVIGAADAAQGSGYSRQDDDGGAAAWESEERGKAAARRLIEKLKYLALLTEFKKARLRFDMAAKSISETITMEAKMAKALANSEAPSGSGSGGPAAAGAASTVHVEALGRRVGAIEGSLAALHSKIDTLLSQSSAN